jgi:hypothetical protein
MKQLEPKIRKSLIAIGHAELFGVTPNAADVAAVRSLEEINCQRPEFWWQTSADLSDSELADLTCGLAYVETEFRWPGGSVSGVIWLFQAMLGRSSSAELLDQVSAWILAKSRNPYNPFGTRISLGAKNYTEYRKLSALRAVEITKRIADDQVIEQRAKADRDTRKRMAAIGAVARGTQVRAEIIKSMNELPLVEKLERIARDSTYPPQFFPTSIADSAQQSDLDALPEGIRLELARRLKGKRKGPWGSFRRRLLVSLGPVWNKKPW